MEGTRHSWTATVNGESVFLTILSKLWSIFSLMAFLNSSISFLISLKRSKFVSSGVLVRLPLLSTQSSPLTSVWFCSYCSCCLISWFCLVSSSTMAASDWTCTASAAGSWLVVDSIWNIKLDGTVRYSNASKSNRPHRWRQIDDARIVSQMRSSRMGSSSYILVLKNKIGAMMHRCGACHGASDAKVRTNSTGRREKFCLKEVRVSVVLFLPLPLGAHVYIYLCMCKRPSLSIGTLMVIFILSL